MMLKCMILNDMVLRYMVFKMQKSDAKTFAAKKKKRNITTQACKQKL